MTDAQSISEHWGKGDVFSRILSAMEQAGIDPKSATIEDLAPVDHFHARGFPLFHNQFTPNCIILPHFKLNW